MKPTSMINKVSFLVHKKEHNSKISYHFGMNEILKQDRTGQDRTGLDWTGLDWTGPETRPETRLD